MQALKDHKAIKATLEQLNLKANEGYKERKERMVRKAI
jgi:hypothetical protein